MCSPSAPPQPDYEGAAEKTAEGNLEFLDRSTEQNRYTENNWWGGTEWYRGTPTFDEQGFNTAMDAWDGSGEAPDRNDYTTYDPWNFDETGYNQDVSTYETDLADWRTKRFDESWINDDFGRSTNPYSDFTDQNWEDEYRRITGELRPVEDDYKEKSTQWTRENYLNPEIQSLIDNNVGMMSDFGEIGSNFLGKLQESGIFDTTFDPAEARGEEVTWNAPSYGDHRQTVYDAMMKRVDDQIAIDQEMKKAELFAGGIGPGDPRWNMELDAIARKHTDARQQAEISAETMAGLGYQSALAGETARFNADSAIGDNRVKDAMLKRTMPLNEYNAFSTGTQLNLPSNYQTTPVATIPGPDYLTASMNQGQFDSSVYSADVASNNNMWNMLGKVGALGAVAYNPSLAKAFAAIG